MVHDGAVERIGGIVEDVTETKLAVEHQGVLLSELQLRVRNIMSEVTIIGIDLAKRSFQLQGADRDGSVVFRKRLSRSQLLGFVSQVPRCVIAIEACATAHGWGREFGM